MDTVGSSGRVMRVSALARGGERRAGLHGGRNGGGRRSAAKALRDVPRAAGRRRAARGFWPGEHGGTAIETALALAVIVAAFAGLMEIVGTVFESDRMNRAARAAAQAVALDSSAGACPAIRRELGLPDDFDCTDWTITVTRGVLPSALDDVFNSESPTGTGDLVFVRIDWDRAAWSFANVVPAANAAEEDEEDEPQDPGLVSRYAIGLARSEPVD